MESIFDKVRLQKLVKCTYFIFEYSSKPIEKMYGHISPISFLAINDRYGHIYTIAFDNCIKVKYFNRTYCTFV